ncbi:uncharacterized protein K02A2.6-like [Pseudomyrmex gracilis]|uniref:uncharacterized protein K02A2.6-like n=1 Tax=Pseudomyrmex gracilis TaxID=219809 RepID=UPI000994E28C|nr:uncharacterized protein K02A2.6-like [Pseudomyrmex gracilis]
MGPFPPSKSGHAYVLVMQDVFSKRIECRPLRKANGKNICEALEELIIFRWGAPHILLTDNGTEFLNKDLKSFTEKYRIEHATIPPYHPQANPVERVNRVVKTMITAFIGNDHREWDVHLSEFRFAYNTAFHTSLQTTPAYLNFGREPQPVNTYRVNHETPVEIEDSSRESWKARVEKLKTLRDWIRENLEEAHNKQAHYYNLHHRDKVYSVGDRVFKRHHVLSSVAHHIAAKLSPKYHGPFTIGRVLSPVTYELIDDAGRSLGKIHVKDLKPHVP